MKEQELTKTVDFGKPYFDEEDRDALIAAFDSHWILNGPKVREFEDKFKEYIGVKHAVAVTSCTAGMHLSLIAAGIKKGDEVIVPAFGFVANGLAILQSEATPKFVEVDHITCNIEPDKIRAAITDKTKAIMLLHYAGYPAKMEKIMEIAMEYDLKIIEDAAHALGAEYNGQKIGTFGDATAFSFGPLKMIVSGGMGGMVTTDDDEIAASIRKLCSYGMDKSMWNRKKDTKPWQYDVALLGHNFRMTDPAAAMGISQLKKLDWILEKRAQMAAIYDNGLSGIDGISIPHKITDNRHVFLYYVIRINAEKFGKSRDELAFDLIKRGIKVSVHWDPPLHFHTLYKQFGYKEGDFIVSEKLSTQVLSLPMHCYLEVEDVEYVVSAIKELS